MSEKYKFNDSAGIYFCTCTIVNWIDLFIRKELKHIIINSLIYCQKEKGLLIHAWCLMSNHLHLIISSETTNLSDILRDFKKYTAKEIIKEIQNSNESRKEWILELFSKAGENINRIQNYKIWQDGNQPKQLLTYEFTKQKLDYIHFNPVEAELVEEPEDYLYSSARDYAGRKGLIKVDIIND